MLPDVEIVRDPPWQQSMINPEGGRILGIEEVFTKSPKCHPRSHNKLVPRPGIEPGSSV